MSKEIKNNNKLWNENAILNAWGEGEIFEKSVNNKDSKNGEYIFFDGPPFANGLPHYGHLLTGFVKDTFARYHTSLGKKCERKFGWDCHGLPAEMESEKELKITGRLAIKNFSGNAKSQVLSISALDIFIKTHEYRELSNDKKNIINEYRGNLKEDIEVIEQNNNILNIIQETQFYKDIPNEICDENGKKLVGIAAFNEHCRNSVMKYTNEWEYYVTRQGRWVDFENSYKTMDLPYMESVISAFGKLYDKGLIYESTRVMPYSWKCETTLSNFETKMDNSYREKESKTCTVKFKLTDCAVDNLKHILKSSIEALFCEFSRQASTDEKNQALKRYKALKLSQEEYEGRSPDIWNEYINFTSVYFLAWTTTPWTLPSNLAIAVGGDIKYSILVKKNEAYIIAEELIHKYKKELEDFEQKLRINGKHLENLEYEPLFPYFAGIQNAFKVLIGDFVSTEDGTGIVHMAPGFGEDDFNLCRANNIPVICPLDDGGKFNDEKITDIPYKLGERDEILKLLGRCVLEEKTNDKGKTDYDGVNEDIIKYLKSQNLWLKTEQYFHNYPHCWRTDAPLIYKAVSSWYVNVAGDGVGKKEITTKNGKKTIKERMIELNKGWSDSEGVEHDGINWIPEHIRDGQFGKWLEGSRDWSISRNRFFGCPIPVWRVSNIIDISMPEGFSSPEALDEARDSKENQNRVADIINRKRAIKPKVFSSIAQMEEFFHDDYIKDWNNGINSGKYIQKDGSFKITDLHRPYIDELVKYEDGFEIRRIEDVFDCWFESGSMPFASVGFTDFTQNETKKKQSTEMEKINKPSNFPADFIVEYVAQTRGWFYTLMILGTALFDEAPFKNCICHGVILDSKGEKLSKRLRNYPDPKEIFEKYGADSMRWFLLKSPVMRGGDLYMDATGDQIKDVSRTVITPFMSAFNFFKTYSAIDKIECVDIINKADKVKSEMNKYILSLTIKTINDIKIAMDSYDTPSACSSFENFLDSLNNLYIRRSKAAFWEGEKSNEKQEAFNTLYSVILNISKAVSSLLPFTTEIIFQQINEMSNNQTA